VSVLLEILPWLIVMLVLMACSAFFSGSEAALFSLRQRDRRRLQLGNRSQRQAAALLADPDRLLSAVLFWNLTVNMAYFAVASIVGFQLESAPDAGPALAYAFAAVALLSIIFFSEMLPKTLAVIGARRLAGWVGLPLTIAVRVVAPLMPMLRGANLLSSRILWPRLTIEPYLQLSDLEEAIQVSTTDRHLADQEQIVLNNIVAMSDIRVDEWMRPRTQFLSFRPPVSLADLKGQMTPSGYVMITEEDSEEIVAAVDLYNLVRPLTGSLERHAVPVTFVPWCTTVADAYQAMVHSGSDVAAVVNELGETIGVVTFEDILDTVFTDEPSRSARLWDAAPLEQVDDGVWRVSGVTSLRRLARDLELDLASGKNRTVAGVVQETLQRLPQQGDEGNWGPFHFRVLETGGRGQMLIQLQRIPDAEREEDG
jgi:CBS domain containing-hemolysin-like protein